MSASKDEVNYPLYSWMFNRRTYPLRFSEEAPIYSKYNDLVEFIWPRTWQRTVCRPDEIDDWPLMSNDRRISLLWTAD